MNKKRGRRGGAQRNEREQEQSALDAVVADFVACGRCSFFLAGYRVLHGVEALQQAAEESDDAWLTLRWNHAMRRLVQESYGSRMDISFYYYDGRCPECERRFVIGAEDVVLDEAEAQLEAEALEEEGHTSEMPEPTMLRVALTEA